MNNPDISNTPEDLYLSREASMAAYCVGGGLEQIRKYNFTQKGFFYSGMYQFTSGLERLCKLILIYDFRSKNNNNFPNNEFIKNCGHNINSLFQKVKDINNLQVLKVDECFLSDNIYTLIVQFLNDFACNSRYYNLDMLSGKNRLDKEPLIRWDMEINEIIIKKHYTLKKGEREYIDEYSKILDVISVVAHESEQGNKINNQNSFMIESTKAEIKSKYSMYYLYSIIRFVSRIFYEIEFKNKFYPYYREYFSKFIIYDKKMILGKKKWNPVG